MTQPSPSKPSPWPPTPNSAGRRREGKPSEFAANSVDSGPGCGRPLNMLGEVLGNPERRTVNPVNLLEIRLISVLGLCGYGSTL